MKYNERKLINGKMIIVMIMGIVGRLIPHIPNVTPLLGLSLFSGANLSRWQAFLVLLVALLVSDVALAALYGYPIFSYWTLFTYSGFAMTVLVGSKCKNILSRWRGLPYILAASLGFWLWTNFGVWLTASLYPKTLSGLGMCYIVALPFLRNAMVGDAIWGAIFFGLFVVEKRRLGARQKALAVK